MKFRPILFSTPMVLALLAGTKTQTRRKVKPSAYQKKYVLNTWPEEPTAEQWNEMAGTAALAHLETGEECCPYGNVGDVLWVRETLFYDDHSGDEWCYQAGNSPVMCERVGILEKINKVAIPSIHMPKSACRLFLEITDIRVERLQEISEADAKAEGADQGIIKPYGINSVQLEINQYARYKDGYQFIWHNINGPGSWESNPYVWAVSFKVIDKPSDFPLMEKPAQK